MLRIRDEITNVAVDVAGAERVEGAVELAEVDGVLAAVAAIAVVVIRLAP